MDSKLIPSSSEKPPERPKRRNKSAHRNYVNVIVQQASAPPKRAVPRITGQPWDDSDDDPICSASESLEDEIFKELERASCDEDKLNEAIKNFDKILNDYKEEEERQQQQQLLTESAIAAQSLHWKLNIKSSPEKRLGESRCAVGKPPATEETLPVVAKEKSKIPVSRQILTKSKTCAIIESKCILKKSISHDGDLSRSTKILNTRSSTTNLFNGEPRAKCIPIKGALTTVARNLTNNKQATPLLLPTTRPPEIKTRTIAAKVCNKPIPAIREDKSLRNVSLMRAKSDFDVRGHSSSRIPVKMIAADIPVVTKTVTKINTSNSNNTETTEVDSPKSIAPIHFAKVVSASNPKLESCKVIPAVPFSGVPKNKPTPVPVRDATKVISNQLCQRLQSKIMPDHEYNSDNSDDSGHISNESASSPVEIAPSFDAPKKFITRVEVHPGKISDDLLKYFDSSREDLSLIAKKAPEIEGKVTEVVFIKKFPISFSFINYSYLRLKDQF